MHRIEAYEKFKASLLTGALKPGQFVTQRELMELVGVPLGAVREAIQRLEHECLLRVYPQRGIQIADITVTALRDALEYRRILELHAIRHYTRYAKLQDVKELELSTRTILDRVSQGPIDPSLQDDAVEVDWRMHDEIIDSLNNEVVSRNYRVNAARIRLMRVSNRLEPERLVTVLNEHLAVLHAAMARDVETAVAMLQIHLDVARQRAIEGR